MGKDTRWRGICVILQIVFCLYHREYAYYSRSPIHYISRILTVSLSKRNKSRSHLNRDGIDFQHLVLKNIWLQIPKRNTRIISDSDYDSFSCLKFFLGQQT